MGLHDPLADGQSQAGVAARVVVIPAGELPEQGRQTLGGYSPAFIHHRDRTWTPSRAAETLMAADPGECLAAFVRRLPMTWTMRLRSAITRGRSSAKSMSRWFLPPALRKELRGPVHQRGHLRRLRG